MKHEILISPVLLIAMSFILNDVQCQTCTPNFCDEVKIKCKEVICEANQVIHRRGGGLCGCCPICTSKSIKKNHNYLNRSIIEIMFHIVKISKLNMHSLL